MTPVEEIIGKDNADECRKSIYNAICNGSSYADIEDMMYGNGLEMDYLFEMF